MNLSKINIRVICQCILCILMSRVTFLGINPVAVSVFVVAFSEKRQRNFMIPAVIFGVFTSITPILSVESGGMLLRYLLIFMCIAMINRIALNRKIYLKRQSITYIAGAVTSAIGLSGSLLDRAGEFYLYIGEGVLVIVIANLLYKGFHLCEYGRINQVLTNEQLISVVIMLTLAANGMPNPLPDTLSVTEGTLFMLVLYISYKYGSQSGAIAGAAAGISASVQGQGAAFVGMYCLIGICTGIVKELGKWASLAVFLISGAAVGIMYPEELWKIDELRAFLSAAAAFVFIPKAVLRTTDDDEYSAENVLIKQSVKQETSRKLAEFAEAFKRLGVLLEKNTSSRQVINTVSVGEIFNELTNSVCGSCVNCSYCWEQRYYDTYHEALGMLGSAEKNGVISREDVSIDFAARCLHFDDFMRETNQQLEIARMSTGWHNKFALNRALAADQMKEVSGLIYELENEISGIDRVLMHEEDELIALLRAFGIRIKKLVILEKRNKRIEITMRAKSPHGSCITMKEISDMVSQVMGGRWKAADGLGSVFPKDYDLVSFIQDVNYRVLTGVARNAREGEDISGDNYSFLKLSNGRVIMTITDGIGYGKLAYDESETVIEMLEQLVEAGFHEDMALRFINSTLVFSQNSDMFSTVDMCVIDLYTGMCECIKCGASATFLKKKHCIRIVHSDTIPVGILPEASSAKSEHKLSPGEFVIMVSDGIADSFQDCDKEQYIKDIIQQSNTDNPQELAEYILERAKESTEGHPDDDMSVIVAGLWEKL